MREIKNYNKKTASDTKISIGKARELEDLTKSPTRQPIGPTEIKQNF